MTETIPTPEDAAAARALEQARLRKERREAKIKAGGSARLNKITGLGGGLQRDTPPQSTPQTTTDSTSTPSATSTPARPSGTTANTPTAGGAHADPDEVDISQHFYTPQTTNRPPIDPANVSEAQLRQMMLGFEGPSPSPGGTRNPFLNPNAAGGPPGMEGLEDDPVMKMMQQMMGSMGGGPGGPGGGPPGAGGFADIFSGMASMPGAQQPGQPTPEQVQGNKAAYIWRILHFVFALGLGIYVVLTTNISFTKTERESSQLGYRPVSATYSDPSYNHGAAADFGESPDARAAQGVTEAARTFFYIFTTIEALLLTTRYFIDRHRTPPQGMLWSVSGFLPAPFKGYVQHGLRYAQILGTVRADALVCVFVMGAACWLRS